MLNMPDDVLERLKDIAIECIKLGAEIRHPDISTCQRRCIQERMQELICERDKIIQMTRGHFCWHLTVDKSGGDDKQNVSVSPQSSPK